MDGTIVTLIEPITVYDKKYAELALREPRGELFLRLGPPRVPVFNQGAGSAYLVDRDDTIKECLKALIALDDDFHIEGVFKKLSLVDTLQLRETLFHFFDKAAATLAAARPSPSSSEPNV